MNSTPLEECGHLAHKYHIAAERVGKMPTLLDFPHP